MKRVLHDEVGVQFFDSLRRKEAARLWECPLSSGAISYATPRMLRLKPCTITVALRAGLWVRVVPEYAVAITDTLDRHCG